MNDRVARVIVRRLLTAFELREGVFSDTKELLENQIPLGVEPHSRQHANFLFYLICQDHGVKSALLYERAKSLYQSHPEAYSPPDIASSYQRDDDPGLIDILETLGVRYPRNGAKAWFANSRRLAIDYDGDARNLFAGESAREIMARIREMYGFGPKTGGLLFRVFVGLGFASPHQIEDINFPTDIHDTRIAALTGAADIPVDITESNYMPYVKLAESTWRLACRHEHVNWLQVDRALWILGSKGCASSRHHDCPLRDQCQLGKEVLL
jgi:hypothetical protein